jgi:alpha-tubulin suppressor-like RCC1 family protein
MLSRLANFRASVRSYTPIALFAMLAVAAACTDDRYNPVVSVAYDQNLDPLAGKSTPASLSLSDTSFDFGVQSVASINNVVITVTNTGTEIARDISTTSLATPFGFKGGTYPGVGGTCGTTIEKSCTLVVSYIPRDVVASTGQLKLSYTGDHTTKNAQVNLRGQGTNIASLRVSVNGVDSDTSSVDWGTVTMGTVIEKTYYAIYAGAVPATGVSLSGMSGQFQLVSSTCSDIVSAKCSFVVRYTATSAGSVTQEFKLTYNNSAYADQSVLKITAAATPAVVQPTLMVTDGGANDFGRKLRNKVYEKTFTVKYAGTVPAGNVTAMPFTTTAYAYKGGTFPGTGGTCTTTISADCTIVLEFSPIAAASYPDQIKLAYSGSAGTSRTVSVGISGTGLNPAMLTISPATDPFDFKTRSLGYAAAYSFTISNPANSVDATSITYSAITAPFSSSRACGATIAAGTSCNVTITFNPVAAVTSTQTMTMVYNDGNVPQTLTRSVTGTGSDAATLVINTVDFGLVIVGNTATKLATVNYFGSLPASSADVEGLVAPFDFAGGNGYPGTGGTCGRTITSSCSINLAFKPAAVQVYSILARVAFLDGQSSTLVRNSFTVRGTGVAPALLAFNEAPTFDFGPKPLNTTSEKSLTLTNSGSARALLAPSIALAAPFAFKGGAYPGTGGTCSSALAAGSCTIVVTFKPTTEAAFTTSLSLTYNTGVKDTSTSINLSGSGYPLASVAIGSLDFGKVVVGNTLDKTLTVTNSGTAAASGITIGGVTAPFSKISTTCGVGLAVGASCQVTVRFSPTRPGSANFSLDLDYNNGKAVVRTSATFVGAGIIPIQVAANGDHTCVRTDSGQAKCWGHNNVGQLGLGDRADRANASISSINLGANRYVLKIAAGYWHNCAILDDQSVKCWGSNFAGQIGIGKNDGTAVAIGDEAGEMGDSLAAVDLGTGRKASDIALGYAHTCVLLDNSTVKCWGLNAQGQLGQGDTKSRGGAANQMGDNLAPVNLSLPAIGITASTGDSCAILVGGKLKCWGDNFYGQLGLNDWVGRGANPNEMGDKLPFVELGTGRTVKAVSSGGAFHCAILDNGQVKCWGRQELGNLGVPTLCQNQDAVAGPCSSTAYPFPLRGYGLLANQMGDKLPALMLGTGRTATMLTSGINSSCALLDDGSIKCWGGNDYGQLGHGNTTAVGGTAGDMGDNLVVTPVGASPVTAISSGSFHNCVVVGTNIAKCWGDNRFGQLVTGDLNARGDGANEMGNNLGSLAY